MEKLNEFSQLIRDDPDYFFKEWLGTTLPPKNREIVFSVRDNERTTVRSGNSSGKTFTAAEIALWFMFAYPPALVIDTAPTGRQVENQFWREFRRAFKGARRPLGGRLLKTQYNIDENWYAIGFSTKDGEEGMEAFQGWHAEHILVIVDEASGVHPKVFEAIQGALAGGKVVRLLLIGNPVRNTGDFADSFKDPQFHKIHISAFDSPNVQTGEIIISGLATRSWVESMKSKYGEDSDIYRIKVLGEFPRKESNTLISVDLVENALNSEREEYGEEEVIGLDAARFGNDRAAFVRRKGNRAWVLEKIDRCDTMQLAGKAKNYLRQFPKAILKIDIVGLGAGIYDRLKEQPSIRDRVFGVSSGAAPHDKESYINIRVEGWDTAKEWLKDAILEPDEDWYQLAQPRYKYLSNGKLQLEAKEDMKKRGVSSPDVADALVLTLSKATEGGEGDFMLV